jgi:hypothetical protein
MFIYKITNIENNQCYIGFDSRAPHLEHRWKVHQKMCNSKSTKFYAALCGNIDKFSYEIIDYADTILDLALKEIYWIDHYKSYTEGYNSTRGGDGLNQDLTQFTNEEIIKLKEQYKFLMTEYNTNVKWKNKSAEERKELTAHLHTKEIYNKKSATLKKFYKDNPEICLEKSAIIKKWRMNNRDKLCENNRKSSLIGAAKVSKRVEIKFQDGRTKIYNSKSEFKREHGGSINAIIMKTKNGGNHKGMQGWEI